MKKRIVSLCVLAFGLYAADSSAQLFKIDIVNESSLNPTIAAALRTALDQTEADINKEFPSNENPTRLMEGMANSSVVSGKGLGSDYSSRMKIALIGVGAGVASDMEKDPQTGSDVSGIGAQAGLTLGTNLGWFTSGKILGLEANRLNVYGNFFKYSYETKMGKADKDQINADMGSYGLHVSYDLIRPSGHALARFGGVKLHTGLERNTTKITFKTTLNETISTTTGGTTVSGNLTGAPEATIDVQTTSIPLEVSTSVQFLYALSLYGGLGTDFNFGSAKGGGKLNANQTTLSCSGGAGCGGTSPIIQAGANIDSEGKVSALMTRGFFGAQINLPFTQIYVQANKVFGSELIGANFGVRFVY